MATTAPQPIVCRTKTEQDLYDQLLLHPRGIEVSLLNPRGGARRRAALEGWMADGLVHIPNYGAHYAVATLDESAVDHARRVDLWAEQIADAWYVLLEAEERLAEAQREEMDALRRTRTLLQSDAPYHEGAQDEVWNVKAWEWHVLDAQEDIGRAVGVLDVTRAAVEEAGGDWAEVTARVEEVQQAGMAEVARRNAAEQARLDALLAGADPLGGDA